MAHGDVDHPHAGAVLLVVVVVQQPRGDAYELVIQMARLTSHRLTPILSSHLKAELIY